MGCFFNFVSKVLFKIPILVWNAYSARMKCAPDYVETRDFIVRSIKTQKFVICQNELLNAIKLVYLVLLISIRASTIRPYVKTYFLLFFIGAPFFFLECIQQLFLFFGHCRIAHHLPTHLCCSIHLRPSHPVQPKLPASWHLPAPAFNAGPELAGIKRNLFQRI